MPDDNASHATRSVVVVGISADGTLADPAVVAAAEVLVGSPRQLDLVPPNDARRMPLPSPLRDGLSALFAENVGRRIVVLASGDPLVAGIASTLIELGADVDVRPAVSSVALARAALTWPAESHAVVRVTDDVSALHRELAPGRRVIVLSADETSPVRIADLLDQAGYVGSTLTVLGDLGTEAASRQDFSPVGEVREATVPRLNIVAVELVGPRRGGWVAGLPDDAFENDGQLTKRDVRASALARLAPVPGEHLWDLGAGAGSVGIEWMRAHPTCTTTAVEADAERVARIGRNAARLGVPGLEVVHGKAPEALVDLRAPDAIFIGGGATAPGLIEQCVTVLPAGGRLVVHGVTLETEQVLARCYAEHGGELTRISVETSAPIGTFTGWTPARAVTQWAWEKRA